MINIPNEVPYKLPDPLKDMEKKLHELEFIRKKYSINTIQDLTDILKFASLYKECIEKGYIEMKS